MSNLQRIVTSNFRKYELKEFLVFKKRFTYNRYTYGDILFKSRQLQTWFIDHKIKSKDKIAICSYNSPEYAIIFIAAILSNITLVPLDFGASSDFINKILKTTKSKLIFTSRKKIIDPDVDIIYVEDLLKKLNKLKPNLKIEKALQNDLLEILYTSGTTGNPKGVMLTHNNLYHNIQAVGKLIKLTPEDKNLSILPMSHIFEQLGFLFLQSHGASIVYLESRRGSEISKIMKKEHVTILITVPAFLIIFKNKITDNINKIGKTKTFNKLLKYSHFLPINLKRVLFRKIHKQFGNKLDKFICGGAPLPDYIEQFWEDIGFKVIKGYGLTETSPVIALTPEFDRMVGWVGKIVPELKVKIGKLNEVLVKGKSVTPGYFKNSTATRKSFKDGWFRTGDVGEISDQGYLKIYGRIKNMILSTSGLNVYPEDIELILNSRTEFKDVCVIGLPQKDKEQICAVVVPKQKITQEKLTKIIKLVNLQLESHQQIQVSKIWHDNDFPKTLTLKIKRKQVLENILNQRIISKTNHTDPLLQLLSELSQVSVDQISEKSLIYGDLGFDSLGIIELGTRIEERLQTTISEHKINKETTVKKLRKLLDLKTEINDTVLPKSMFSKFWEIPKLLLTDFIYFIAQNYFSKITILGKQNLKNLPKQAIYIANHNSHLDVIAVFKYLPRNVKTKLATAAAADYFFKDNNILNRFISTLMYHLFGAYPMPRNEKEKSLTVSKAFEISGEILDKGWSLFILPEGSRGRTKDLAKFKVGTGVLVKESGLPVVPIKLSGLFEIMPKGQHWPKKGEIRIHFGKPMQLDRNLSAEEITKVLYKKMSEMK